MTLPSRETMIEMALATLRNYIEGDEHTRDEDAKFALQILERYLKEQSTGKEPSER